MVVHPGGTTGAEHLRRDRFAVERKPLTNSQFRPTGLVVPCDQQACAVGLEAEQSRMAHPQAPGQLVGYRAEHLGRSDPACDQCRHPSQRSLQVDDHAKFVTAVLSLDGTCPGQVCQRVGHQRDNQENADHSPVFDSGQGEVRRPAAEVVEGDGAGHRRRRREPESPRCGDHQNPDQIHHAERIAGGDLLE